MPMENVNNLGFILFQGKYDDNLQKQAPCALDRVIS